MITTKKYYVIDDDLDDQQFLIEALIENDPTAQCVIARNGQQGIQQLKLERILPDAVFLDQNMPGLTGKQCLLLLKQLPSSFRHLLDLY